MHIEDMAKWAEAMRAAGVARIKTVEFSTGSPEEFELELAPYVPQPPPGDDPDFEPKADGLCAMPGCTNPAGWHLAPAYCQRCGLKACGVTGVPSG